MRQNNGSRLPFRYRLAQWMSGRNGNDRICIALMILYAVLLVVNLFLRSTVVYIAIWLVLGYDVFRILSRNVTARRREEAVFLNFLRKIKGFFLLCRNRYRDRKTHVYRRCSSCRNILRLPRVKGNHEVECPVCRHRFSVKI